MPICGSEPFGLENIHILPGWQVDRLLGAVETVTLSIADLEWIAVGIEMEGKVGDAIGVDVGNVAVEAFIGREGQGFLFLERARFSVPVKVGLIAAADENILPVISVEIADLNGGDGGGILNEDTFGIVEGTVFLLVAQLQADGCAEGDDVEAAVVIEVGHTQRLEGLIDNHALVLEAFVEFRQIVCLFGIRLAHENFEPRYMVVGEENVVEPVAVNIVTIRRLVPLSNLKISSGWKPKSR